MEKRLSFDDLPKKVAELDTRLDRMEKMLEEVLSRLDGKGDQVMTVEQAAKFLSLAQQTIYEKVSKREIPFIKRDGGKRVYFLKSSLIEWLKEGVRKTRQEFEIE
jgi:excisionase family DNA binding protein